jgi:hypothetical protein
VSLSVTVTHPGPQGGNSPLSLELRELDVSELASREEGSGRELGSRALNESLRHDDCVCWCCLLD